MIFSQCINNNYNFKQFLLVFVLSIKYGTLYFFSDVFEKKCDVKECGETLSNVSHAITRLPRILVIFIYTFFMFLN